MKKKIYLFIFSVVLFAAVLLVVNIEVSTRQGIDSNVSVIKIPVYLKSLDFIDRHYNYRQLVGRINSAGGNPEEKVLRILSWVYVNIKRQPEGLPVVDDHVWHIIVRGYGVVDQFSDVFATLCNYAGYQADYLYINSDDRFSKAIFSFVMLDKKWYVFDPYNGIYFKAKSGGLADVQCVKEGTYELKSLDAAKKDNLNYEKYIRNLPDNQKFTLKRENIQSPFRRLLYGIKQLTSGHLAGGHKEGAKP